MTTSEPLLHYLVIIPTRNEARILERSVELLHAFLATHWDDGVEWKIVIADNGSTDNSRAVCASLTQRFGKRVGVVHITMPGRGNALKTVIRQIPANFYGYLDADIPIPPESIPDFFAALENGADIVVGRRSGRRPLLRRVLSIGIKLLNHLFLNLWLNDAQCGAKALSGNAARILLSECRESGFFLDTELLALANHHGLTIREAPVSWIEQRFPERKSTVHPIKDSIAALRAIVRINATHLHHSVLSFFAFLGLGAMLAGASFAPSWILRSLSSNSVIAAHSNEWMFVTFVTAFVFLVGAVFTLKWIPDHLLSLCFVVILCIAAMIAVNAIQTSPFFSQDAYWNIILARGWVNQHLNPYLTAPAGIPNEPYLFLIAKWRNLSMTHGPLWVFIVSGAAFVGSSFSNAIVTLKIINAIALAAVILIFWKLLGTLIHSPRQRLRLLTLFVWSPFVFQVTLIDAHNDIYVLLSILLSYYLLRREHFTSSAMILVFGGLVKFIPLLLIPVPLIYGLRAQKTLKRKLFFLGTLTILSALVIFAAYYPFGFSRDVFAGLSNEFFQREHSAALFGTVLLQHAVDLPPAILRLLGLCVTAVLVVFFTWRKQALRAYVIPLLILLFFFTPWFQLWYILWTLPLLLLWLPLYGSVLLMFFLVALGYGTGAFIGSSLTVLAFVFVQRMLRFPQSTFALLHRGRADIENPPKTR